MATHKTASQSANVRPVNDDTRRSLTFTLLLGKF
jgi:hypothetical protein